MVNEYSVAPNTSTQMRIGVFGGSFDPIHYGHLAAAEEAYEVLGLSQVLFVPAMQPPHKSGIVLAPYRLRCAMVKAAIEDNRSFALSYIEQELPRPSYTVQTLNHLQQQNPGAEFYFITGADMFLDLSTWKEVEYMLNHYHFVAIARPGWSQSSVLDIILQRWAAYSEHLHVINGAGVAISATEVRHRVQTERSLRYLVPDSVIALIKAHHLYHSSL